ncbi:hypothetical protein VTJ83DRAFT_4269 [Remersonia thermophila]|uniref:Uncharacterized protein n=1 Tax=Remersonia thermophila TaxID=72144 RepID=A0ABR4D9F0_9PEZI
MFRLSPFARRCRLVSRLRTSTLPCPPPPASSPAVSSSPSPARSQSPAAQWTGRRRLHLTRRLDNVVRPEPLEGLGSHVYLEKQDKLREIGVDIPTSQIVVVGSQSSGKSSLLESLTGFAFPRGQGLCTRYATQITLRRSAAKRTVITIIPWSDSSQARKDRLRAFHRELDSFDGTALGRVIEEANEVMGVRSAFSNDASLPMFSDDILKVEISGPEQPHLTVIDVPGLFQVTDEGITTEHDKLKVENMVRRYMEHERTIILAVLSCLSDRATEGVLQLAKQADPDGLRTVGVLTKADLVKEQAVIQTILDLVRGKTLKLSYFVVRNRGADEDTLTVPECHMKEQQVFAEPQWAELVNLGRTGVPALRAELQSLLTELARRELPKQRTEVEQRLARCRKKLLAMGPPRNTAASQRECLVKLASQFGDVVRDALDGRYDGHAIFSKKPELKLATNIIHLNEGFADFMAKKGHSWEFGTKQDSLESKPESKPDSKESKESKSGSKSDKEKDKDKDKDKSDAKAKSQEPPQNTGPEVLEYEKHVNEIRARVSSIPELQQLVRDNMIWPEPTKGAIMSNIERHYSMSRGPELGTFGGSLLAMIFREQASKWRSMVMAHVESVIVTVHQFIQTLLEETVEDKRMREELFEIVLLGHLQNAYRRAKEHAEFLLRIELDGRPSTYNHYFNDNLQVARSERLTVLVKATAVGQHSDDVYRIKLSDVGKIATNKSNADQVKEDIHDVLKSYYKVSRKRFVDTVCRVAIEHYLLDDEQSPLKIFNPKLVATLSDEQLEMIAGEDNYTKWERERLTSEIEGLEAAMRVLRS